jgi:hypothetical protein
MLEVVGFPFLKEESLLRDYNSVAYIQTYRRKSMNLHTLNYRRKSMNPHTLNHRRKS